MDPVQPHDSALDGLEAESFERALQDNVALSRFEKAHSHYRAAVKAHPSFDVIPRLVQVKGKDVGLHSTIRDAARDIHYQRRTKAMVAEPDKVLKTLWEFLQLRSRADGANSEALWINYRQMVECRDLIARESPRIAALLQPQLFLRLHRNDRGEVSAHSLIDIVVRQVTLWQVRLDLCSYDFVGNGELTEVEVQAYIRDRIEVLPLLNSLVKDFHETYSVYAARKFCFFLDKHRVGRIRIKDLLRSDVLVDFNKMQYSELDAEAENSNWFSVPFVSRVHGDWVELDADESGLLNERELAKYGSGGFTEQFIDRIFQYCQTYNGEIDYKVYLDLVLVKMHPKAPESIRFLAHLLDVGDVGKITRNNVAHFWAGILAHPLMAFGDSPSSENIVNEVFDMVNPRNSDYMTISELVNSGVGHTVCGILTDVDAFLVYDNREAPDASQ